MTAIDRSTPAPEQPDASAGVSTPEGASAGRATPRHWRRLPVWGRAILLILGVSVVTGAAALYGDAAGMQTRAAVLLSLPVGFAAGSLLALLLVLMPEWRAQADRRWLAECLTNVAKVDREHRFSVLLAQGDDHELSELARAIHAAVLSAHRDRLEAAQLRRELDARVQRRTRAAVAELQKLSHTDELTGLLNRRGFDQAFEDAWTSAAAAGEELAALAVDMDFFKQLNDTCGHDAGDRALRAAGEVMRSQLRGGDLAARLGGDEFLIVLRETSSTEARAVARRLGDLFARSPHALGIPGQWPTFSIGIACAGEHRATGPEHLRRLADEALYASKRGGRSQTSVWSPEAAASPAKPVAGQSPPPTSQASANSSARAA
ncbi:MAG: GGDEF domain-containing protein [Planctomycetota bacterium]|nr:GGDEF domain-containing protein [Planctomycetota bacterium]